MAKEIGKIKSAGNVWESEDKALHLTLQLTSTEIVWVRTGRVNFVSCLSLFSLVDLGTSWFLNCDQVSSCIELLSNTEMLALASFLGLTPEIQ
jgi:hypothetical protein